MRVKARAWARAKIGLGLRLGWGEGWAGVKVGAGVKIGVEVN